MVNIVVMNDTEIRWGIVCSAGVGDDVFNGRVVYGHGEAMLGRVGRV